MTTIRKIDDNEQVTKKVWSIVDRLPQRDLIEISDARQWVSQVVADCSDLAVWHAIRLNGFGGSEIGVLVRNRAGVRGDHQASAHDIVLGKLMRKTPSEDSGHLRRGHAFEPLHAEHYYAKYNAHRDVAAYEALKNATSKHVWMRYSPDDLVKMPGGYFEGRWLIDYKAPSKVDDSDSVAFQYACQLTQGALLCAENGIEINGLMLSQFDWAGWRLKDDLVAWDPSLGQAVIDAGNHYWSDFVMRGEVPEFIYRKAMTGIEDFTKEYARVAQQLAALQALSKAIEDRTKLARKELTDAIGDVRLGGQKIVFGDGGATDLTVAAKRLIDKDSVRKHFTAGQLDLCKKSGAREYDKEGIDAMSAALKQLGGDPKQFSKFALDPDKVFDIATQMDMDAELLIEEQITISPGPQYKAQAEQYVASHFPIVDLGIAADQGQMNAEQVMSA